MSRTYIKHLAITVLASVVLSAKRFVAHDGGYPSAAGGLKTVAGVTETSAEVGDAVSAIVSYSAPVEAGGAVAAGAFVKPDATGRAVTGTAADHCGRALSAAAAEGDVIEVVLYRHIHA